MFVTEEVVMVISRDDASELLGFLNVAVAPEEIPDEIRRLIIRLTNFMEG